MATPLTYWYLVTCKQIKNTVQINTFIQSALHFVVNNPNLFHKMIHIRYINTNYVKKGTVLLHYEIYFYI